MARSRSPIRLDFRFFPETQQARARHEPHMRQNGSAHEINL